MITDAILTLVLAPLRWLLQAIPGVSWPSWFQTSGAESVVAKVGQWGQSLGTINGWFPVDAFLDSMGILFVCAAVHAGIKSIRIVISVFTGGGGAI